jgi:hypothetical protein
MIGAWGHCEDISSLDVLTCNTPLEYLYQDIFQFISRSSLLLSIEKYFLNIPCHSPIHVHFISRKHAWLYT